MQEYVAASGAYRTMKWTNGLLFRALTESAGQSIAVITHGDFIQAPFRDFFGFGDASFRLAYPAIAHTSITHWRAEPGSDRSVLEYSNDARHLCTSRGLS